MTDFTINQKLNQQTAFAKASTDKARNKSYQP
jgi:hypothetical protein